MENEILIEALNLLMIGMTTVFVVLFLVVQSSKLLIKVSNKLFNLQQQKSITQDQLTRSQEIVIKEAVLQWSEGKAKVSKIRRSRNF